MGLFEHFPYTNFHDMNTDWLVKVAKEFMDKYETLQSTIDGATSDITELAETLEAQLNAWYTTHSADIANQLAESLTAISTALNSATTAIASDRNSAEMAIASARANSITDIQNTLADAKDDFDDHADEYGAEVIDSLPPDYLNSLYGAHMVYPQHTKGITGVMAHVNKIMVGKRYVAPPNPAIVDDATSNIIVFETGKGFITGDAGTLQGWARINRADGNFVSYGTGVVNLAGVESTNYVIVNESDFDFLDLDFMSDGMPEYAYRKYEDVHVTNFSTASQISAQPSTYSGTNKAFTPFRMSGTLNVTGAVFAGLYNPETGAYIQTVTTFPVTVKDKVVIVFSDTPSDVVIQVNDEGGGGGTEGAVLYSESQNLTTLEKTQAKVNIGANFDNDINELQTTALSLTDKVDDVEEETSDLKTAFDDTVILWNAIESNTIAEKTYDNSGKIGTNTTFYTVMNIPVTPGQVWYAYSVYSHTSSAYNHKIRKVNFYNGTSYVSMLEYVNQWTIPENITSMNVSMAYIGNSFDNGRSADDYITIYEEGNRYNHLSDRMRLVDDNVPDGFISNRMLQNKYGEAWNAISTGTILENTFIRTNGQIVSSTSFYTITNVPVQVGQAWYAFCAYNKSARFVTFYNSSGSAVGGYEYIKSWTIPTDVTTMSVTLNYTDGAKSSRDYVTSQLFEIVQEIQTEDKKYGNRETRICTINFQFDDGNVKDADIFNIFNNNGVPCGFALISNISTTRVPEYLMYQRNGFEILSHSTDSAGMSSASLDPSTVNTKLQNSRKVLEGYGFIVRGWVTPYSEMNTAFIPLMQRYYDFGSTVYYGEYDGTGTPYQTINNETSKLFRVSLQSTTLENQKKAVDEAILNNGFLTFYGHSADLDGTDNETTANLNSLLSYINSKVSQLRCIVLKPSDAVDYYFHVRHSDYLTLLNT